MDDLIVFAMGCIVCLGVWYGIAWLDRWNGDRKRNKGI